MAKALTAKQKAQAAANKGKTAAKSKAVAGCPLAGLAPKYADCVKASKPWRWDKIGKGLTRAQRSEIRHQAIQQKLIPKVKVNSKGFSAFPKKFVKADNTRLPKNLWKSTDSVQFTWLNNDLAARNLNYDPKTQTFLNDPSSKKYTWHHHQDDGRMQLVEFGVHNATNHNGGRTTWAQGKR